MDTRYRIHWFYAVYILSGIDFRFHWSNVSQWLCVLADLFLILAMSFFFVVFKKNTYLNATIEVQDHQQVISEGPYTIVRHPMYSATLLLFMFTPLALGSYYALITFPLMILVLVLRCLDEEKALKKDLPDYESYCKRVKYRLVPFIY